MNIRLKTRVKIGAGTLRGTWGKRLQAAIAVLTAWGIGSAAATLHADPLYWDGPTSSIWNTTAPWDTAADGTGGDPVAAPGATDIASFNVSPLIDPQIVILDANQQVQGLAFSSSGNVTIRGTATPRTLTIGASGITKTGTTGITTIGSTVLAERVNFSLAGSQTWSNDATDPTATFLFPGGGNTAIVSIPTADAYTLTLAGSNTGANAIHNILTNGATGAVLSVVKDGPGTWVYSGGISATYTGGLTINQGIFANGSTTNATGLGTGTLTLNGGELRGNAVNMRYTTPIHVTANSTLRPTNLAMTAGLQMNFGAASPASGVDLSSAGTPGNGPVLAIEASTTSASAGTLNIGGTSTINGFNGTFLINQLAGTTTGPRGTTVLLGGTTAGGTDGSNAKFEINGPGPSDNPTLGISGGVRVRIGLSNTVTTTKMGELSGSGSIAGGSGAAGNHTLEIGHLNTNSTFTGDIIHFTGVGLVMDVKKVGTGSLTLSGNSDYLGVTTVSNGTLVVGADAGIAKFLPTDAKATVSVASNVITSGTAATPIAHGLADGDRIMAYSGLAVADTPTIANKPLYVKVVTPTTYELYTDPALTTLQSFTDDASFSVTMPTALGANTSPVVLGESSNSATLLAGTASNPSVLIARSVVSGGSGVNTLGSTQNGNSVYSGAISLNNSATVTSASTGGNQLLISGQITGAGGLTKTGSGLATLSNPANSYAGDTTVAQGQLSISDDFLADSADVSIAAGAILDLNFSAGTPDIIRSLYLNGVPQPPGLYGSTGLGSSFFSGTGLLSVQTLGILPGDFDADGDVDGADFVAWQTNFPKTSGASSAEGDADGDADVDGADFAAWQSGFDAGPGASPVPEPQALIVLTSALLSLGIWRRFK